MMAAGTRGISNGPNSRPLDDTISGSAPGIPDDALAPGETLEDALPDGVGDLAPEELKDKVFGTRQGR